MLLIKNAHILPITGKEIRSGSVLIDQGKISAIGNSIPYPPSADIIDAGGRLAVPVQIHPLGAVEHKHRAADDFIRI